jgi:tetratricopeptide (TPR) repeat protein
MSFSRRLLVLPLLVLPFSTFLASCSRSPAVRRQKAVERGDREFSQGKYPEAIIYYGQALQIDKYYPEAHYKLGLSYAQVGSWASAFRELSRTVELQADNWPAQLKLAELSLRGGKAQEAKDRAQLILRSNPKNVDAQLVLSSSDAALGDSKAALSEAVAATQMAPDQPSVYSHLGLLYAASGDAAKAEENLKKAQSLDTAGITSTMTLGNFYEQQRRWSNAQNAFQSAITRAPGNPVPRAALATVYMNQGQAELAEKILTDAKAQLQDDPSAYRMLGDYYLGRNDNAKALAEFSALSNEHPKDAQVRKTYIQLLVLNHRVAEAASLNDQLLKATPQDLEAQVLKGEIQNQQGKLDDSIQTLQKVLHDAPENAFAHYQMGLVLQEKGKTQEAESALREAVHLSPTLFEAWRMLGENAIQRADWASLRNIATEVLRIAPRASEGYLFDATARINQNDAAGAEADLNKLTTLAPNSPIGYVKLGQLRVSQKRLNDAEVLFHQALSHDPNSIEAIQGLVDLQFRRNQPQDAFDLLKTSIDQNPNSAALYLLQGQAFAQNQQLPEAEKPLEHALQLDPKNIHAVILLGQLQANRGAKDQAIATYQRAIEQAPNTMSLQLALGALYESAGNWQSAQVIYQKVLTVQPDNPFAANNLAYILLDHGGSVNMALNLAQAARRGLPNSPNTADTLGWAYYQNGAYSVAAPLLEEAVSKSADNAAYRYHLGVTYQKLNDNVRARTQLEKAIGLNPASPIADQSRRALGQSSGS